MEAQEDNPQEAEGVLNPAVVRGKDKQLYLFPRLVARGNYSRIGVARVLFDRCGDPTGVERLGVALEPEADYELSEHGGGCEDPRISFFEPLRQYVMTYTALSRDGPRIAIALSDNLVNWRRLGLATFRPYKGIAFDAIDNKDASVFPMLIPGPAGYAAVALLHRPLFPGTRPEEKIRQPGLVPEDPRREGIWISYCKLGEAGIGEFSAHHPLAAPVSAWEQLKIGGGAPPILCRHGWLMIYHGVGENAVEGVSGKRMSYAAGAMILAREHPHTIIYRSPEPVLVPEGPLERLGAVDSVVFPTGIDRRDDLREPDRFDIYYGMADHRIGVARLDVPASLYAQNEVDRAANGPESVEMP